MSIRLIVLINSQAGFISTYHPNKQAALKFIADWKIKAKLLIENGQEDSELYSNTEGTWAVFGRNIIGMYIPETGPPSATDRIADVLEKQANEGEDWK